MWFLPVLNSIVVLVVLSSTIYGFVVHYFYTRAKRLMPEVGHPEGYVPIFGHIFTFILHAKNTATLRNHLNHYACYYKKGFFGILGHQLWLFAIDHQMLQEIFSSPDAVEKCYIYQALDLITDGSFTSSGNKWKKLRKALNATFSVKQLDAFMDTINHNLQIFLDINIKKIAQENNFVDIQPYIARCYFDIITKTHFGIETNDQINADSQITERASKVVDDILQKRFLRPHLHPTTTFQFTNLYKEIIEIRKEPLAYIENVIERRLKYLEDHTSNESSESLSSGKCDYLVYIDQLIPVLKELNITPNSFNLQRNSGDVLIAGSDTPAVAAAAILYHLALNKDMQEKVYQEVSTYCGQDSYKPLTRQDINSMTYLDMVMNEGLRWSAPAGVARAIENDFTGGSYTIPKGTCVYLLMSPQHLNPEHYERPSEFYPEHFNSEAIRSRPKMAFIPFISGPRNCPGKMLAYLLIKASVAVVVNKYHLETNLPLKDVKLKIVLMSQHAQGYPIRFSPRHTSHPSD